MRPKRQKLFIACLLVSAGIMASGRAMPAEGGKSEPLVIQEQGSFAAGGTVITNPGTFDP